MAQAGPAYLQDALVVTREQGSVRAQGPQSLRILWTGPVVSRPRSHARPSSTGRRAYKEQKREGGRVPPHDQTKFSSQTSNTKRTATIFHFLILLLLRSSVAPRPQLSSKGPRNTTEELAPPKKYRLSRFGRLP